MVSAVGSNGGVGRACVEIVGYVGPKEAVPILLEGLRRLEYRGYDSAGVSVQNGAGLKTVKRAGKIAGAGRRSGARPYRRLVRDRPHPLGHARGAQPGERAPASERGPGHRARAQRDHRERSGDSSHARRFGLSVHLRDRHRSRRTSDRPRVPQRGREARRRGRGRAPAGRGCVRDCGRLVPGSGQDRRGALRQSPSAGDLQRRLYIVASDVAAVIAQTRDVVYLDDGDYAVLDREGYHTYHLERGAVSRAVHEITWDLDAIEKGGFEHFMLKEIFEQPSSLRDVMRGRLLEEEGNARLGGITVKDGGPAQGPPYSDHRLWHQLARRSDRRIHVGGIGAHTGRGGVRPQSCATGIR